MKFATKVVHGGVKPDPATGAVNTPIYQTSTFVQESPAIHRGYTYSRGNNPTREALENSIASLENGKFSLAFASGIAAVDAVIRLLKPGNEVITTSDLYGGSFRLFTKISAPAGIEFVFIDLNDPDKIEAAISDKSKLIWLESPTNPMMNIIDIAMVAEVAKKHQLLLAVDNTFATPCLQRPLELGADISVHSATKYLGGHSDIILGAVALNDEELYQKLKFIQNTCGAIPGPNDCFLTLRGIKTLLLRMERSCANALKIAQFLAENSKVKSIYYPGLEEHPNHDMAVRQMSDFGAMLSFDLREDTKEAAIKALEKMQLFVLAESLGGVESLCGHPASMSHGSMPKEERIKLGIGDSLIRLSIGIEDADDLIEDLKLVLS